MKKNTGYWEKLIISISDKAPKNVFIFDIILFLLRYKRIKNTSNLIKRIQWYSKDEIDKYHLTKLQEVVKYSYENVPYYKDLFDKFEIKPEDIKNFDDFYKIPFLTREIIRKNSNNLKSKNVSEIRFRLMATSGSTGKPLEVFVDKIKYPINAFAYYSTIINRAGCGIFDKSVNLTGIMSIPSENKGKFWKYKMLSRKMHMSLLHLNKENIPKYIEKIRKFNPKYILTYPSAIIEIARYIKENQIKPIPSLKVVISAGETLYDWQKKIIEESFQCRVVEFYGHSESTTMAVSCEKNNFLHFFPEFGFVELINKDGNHVKKDGEKGEIVTTGFMHILFPFIRYKTGDIGILSNEKCSCGRNCLILKKIEGKWQQEYIYSKDDVQIPFTSLYINFKIFKNVEQFQFYQEEKGVIILRILKRETYSSEDTKNIRQELSKLLGSGFELKIKFVDEVPKTAAGKYSYLVQKISKE